VTDAALLPLDRPAAPWEDLLGDPCLRNMLDHALFPLRIQPSIRKIPDNEKPAFLAKQFKQAQQTISMFILFWENALKECREFGD